MLPWNSKICSSLVVTHESWVPFCFGIRQCVIVNSPPSWPNRIPQVSMFLELFSLATFRNWLDNEIGILIFVSEEVIEDGDSMIFSWSDTVAKIKYQSTRPDGSLSQLGSPKTTMKPKHNFYITFFNRLNGKFSFSVFIIFWLSHFEKIRKWEGWLMESKFSEFEFRTKSELQFFILKILLLLYRFDQLI